MKKNHIVEILLTIILLIGVLKWINSNIKAIPVYNYDSDQVYFTNDTAKNNTFPVYKNTNKQLQENDNYLNGVPPTLSSNEISKISRSRFLANATDDNRATYSFQSATKELSYSNQQQPFSSMPVLASHSTGNGNLSTSNTGTRSFYTSNFSNNSGPSKVPFGNISNDIILIDPMADPLDENRIPVGDGWHILIVLGFAYAILKKFIYP